MFHESKSESSSAAMSAAATSAIISSSGFGSAKATVESSSPGITHLSHRFSRNLPTHVPLYGEGNETILQGNVMLHRLSYGVISKGDDLLSNVDVQDAIPLGLNKTVFSKHSSLLVLEHTTNRLTEIPIHCEYLHHLEEISSHEIAICGNRRIQIWDFRSERVTKVPQYHFDGGDNFTFSPDKQKVIFFARTPPWGEKKIILLDLETNQSQVIPNSIYSRYPTSAIFYSNESFLIAFSDTAYNSHRTSIERYKINGEKSDCYLVDSRKESPRIVFSPEGKFLALLTSSTTLYKIPEPGENNGIPQLVFEKPQHAFLLKFMSEHSFVYSSHDGIFLVAQKKSGEFVQTFVSPKVYSNFLIRNQIVEGYQYREQESLAENCSSKISTELRMMPHHDMSELNEILLTVLPELPTALIPMITGYTLYEPRMFRTRVLAENVDYRRRLLHEENARMRKSKITDPEYKQAEKDSKEVGGELILLQRLQVNLQTMTAEKAVDETRRSFPDIPVTKAITNLFCLFKTEDAKANHAHQQSIVVAATQPAGKTKRNDCCIS